MKVRGANPPKLLLHIKIGNFLNIFIDFTDIECVQFGK